MGNIFMNLEEAPNEENKIVLDKNETDINGIPITNLYYKKSKKHYFLRKQFWRN